MRALNFGLMLIINIVPGISNIVRYTQQFKHEAAAAHEVGKRFFLGETNSGGQGSFLPTILDVHDAFLAACGGGDISGTFGAALWIVDYSLQAALNGVERLYFHQGTIDSCVSQVPQPASAKADN